jgi:hypothetical protein
VAFSTLTREIVPEEEAGPMKNQGNSMQTQNPLSQAQQSLDHVHNAVAMAESHPEQQMIQNAENSVEKAERAVEQMKAAKNPGAVDLAQSELQQEKDALNKLQ